MQYPQYREEGPGKKRVDEKKKRERGGGAEGKDDRAATRWMERGRRDDHAEEDG